MSDAGAGAHDLYVPRFDSAFVAQTISVCDRAFTDVNDDLDIGMHLQRKSRIWRDLLVVPHAHAPQTTSRWILFRRRGKVTPAFEPAEVLARKPVERPAFNHRRPRWLSKGRGGCAKRTHSNAAVSFPCLRMFLPLLLAVALARLDDADIAWGS